MSASSFDLGATARVRRLVPRSRRPHPRLARVLELGPAAAHDAVRISLTRPSDRTYGRRRANERTTRRDATRRDATRPLPIFTERRKHSIAVNQSIAITPRCVLLAPSIVRSRRLPRLARSRARSPSSGALSRARVPRRPTVPPSRRLDRPRHGTEASIDRGLDEGSRSVTLVQYGTYMGYERIAHGTTDRGVRRRSTSHDGGHRSSVVCRRSPVVGRE